MEIGNQGLDMQEIVLRTAQERDSEYSKCALFAGDKAFKIKLLMAEISALDEKMKELVAEKVQEPVISGAV